MEKLNPQNPQTPSMDPHVRNTKKGTRSWGPNTWNNYTEEDYLHLLQFLREKCTKWAINKEIGEKTKTPHLQFCMYFRYQVEFNDLKRWLPKCNLTNTKNWHAAWNYCTKEKTSIDSITHISDKEEKLIDFFNVDKTRNWQQLIMNIIEEPINDRIVNWFWDPSGNMGKTRLAKHLCMKYPNEILYVNGKAKDVKYAIMEHLSKPGNKLKALFYALPREIEGKVSYTALEQIKDGIFFSPKFKSSMCIFNPPHLFVLANESPDKSKLSQDRWNIIDCQDFEAWGGPVEPK